MACLLFSALYNRNVIHPSIDEGLWKSKELEGWYWFTISSAKGIVEL